MKRASEDVFNIFYRLQKSPFVFSNGVGVCQVQTGMKIPVVFLQISVAIDLHEEPTFIPHGIIANSITQPFHFELYYA